MPSRFLVLYLVFAIIGLIPLSAKEDDYTLVRGRVVDAADSTAMEFVNVAVTSRNGKILSVCSTEEDGSFSLKVYDPGTFDIQMSFIGYSGAVRHGVVCDGKHIDIGTVALERSSEELSAASISEKVLI